MQGSVTRTSLTPGGLRAGQSFLGVGFRALRKDDVMGPSTSGFTAEFPVKRSRGMYSRALELARQEEDEKARKVFAGVCAGVSLSTPHHTTSPYPALTELHPDHHKAWVSWAQLEKRIAQEERFARCRDILQRGLTLNPDSVFLIQAWGLMELQRGNFFAAVVLLERCAQADPARCSPVLRWKPVRDAQRTVRGRLQGRRRNGPI